MPIKKEPNNGLVEPPSTDITFQPTCSNNLPTPNDWPSATDSMIASATRFKLYRDWKLCGDTDWLQRLWPSAKRALEFAWIENGWDGNRDGVAEGVQHNTYDVEFYGPNPLCGIYYLGALRAGEEMARVVGDQDRRRSITGSLRGQPLG